MRLSNLNIKSSESMKSNDNNSEHMFRKRRGRPSKKQLDMADLENTFEGEEELIPAEHTEEPVYETNDDIEELEGEEIKKVDEAEEIDEVDKMPVKVHKLTQKEKKLKYYVDTKKLEYLILQYNTTGVIDDELATALSNIAHRVAYMPNFINYSWKEEMVGDGMIKEFTALKNKKYDPKKGRAFAYFTQIVYHAFCNKIKKENKSNEVLKDYQNEEYDKLMFEYGIHNGKLQTSENEIDEGDV